MSNVVLKKILIIMVVVFVLFVVLVKFVFDNDWFIKGVINKG